MLYSDLTVIFPTTKKISLSNLHCLEETSSPSTAPSEPGGGEKERGNSILYPFFLFFLPSPIFL